MNESHVSAPMMLTELSVEGFVKSVWLEQQLIVGI